MNTMTRAQAGAIITMKGRDFYIADCNGDSLQMIALDTMEEYSGRAGSNPVLREATAEERGKCRDHILAQYQLAAAFIPGTIVRFTKPAKTDEYGLHVITASNDKTVTVHPLGGSPSGRYLRTPRKLLTIQPLADILK